MRITQATVCNESITDKDYIGIKDSEDKNEVFKPESRIIIDGKVYLIQRHFSGKRDLRDAVFTVVKNDAKRVLLDVS